MKHFFVNIQFCILAVSIGLTQQTEAQDGVALRDLEVNPSLINAKKPLLRKSEQPPLRLPFFEDFSSLRSPYPNPNLWQDNQVFVNASFPLFPPTIGVATFDALDANGRLYEHAASYPFGADTLTSRPIRLDSIFDESPRKSFVIMGNDTIIGSTDTVFFSFYYQPGGGFGNPEDGTLRGRQPRRDDVLILEFLQDTVWEEIRRINGQTLEQFCPLCLRDSIDENVCINKKDTTIRRKIDVFEKEFFKHVSFPIKSSYLQDKFQFRFRNFSSLDQNNETNPSRQSLGGQWHIDYIRLDVKENIFFSVFDIVRDCEADTILRIDTIPTPFARDIAFVDQGKRVLKDFQAMPYKQFQGQSDLVSEIPVLIRNLDYDYHRVNYSFQLTGVSGSWDTTANPDIYPFHTNGFYDGTDYGHAGINIYSAQQKFQQNFQTPKTSGKVEIKHILTSPTDINKVNDTMIQTVHFGNYYAYDDGTPEKSFGFVRQNAGSTSEFAYQFPMRVADTLVGVQIWFNHTLNNMSRAFFNLAVWSAENDGTPSQSPIYTGPDQLPIYGETIGYTTYWLTTDTILQPGSYFIGFQQRHNTFLNIGFDQNSNAYQRMFYNVHDGKGWQWFFDYGSVMIRPVFGTRDATRVYDRNCDLDMMEKIKVFPNPSNGIIFVESPENIVNTCEIYDVNGRRLLQKTIRSTEFSIRLPEKMGAYILILHTETGIVSKKIIRQ